MHMHLDNVVAAVTGLQIKQPRNHGLIPIIDTSPKCPAGSGFHWTTFLVGMENFSPMGKWSGMKVAIHICLVPRLRMSDEIPPFPHMPSCWA